MEHVIAFLRSMGESQLADEVINAHNRLTAFSDGLDTHCLNVQIAALRQQLEAAGLSTGEAIGEMRENGVTWFKGNPHSFPVGTKFCAIQQPAGEPVPEYSWRADGKTVVFKNYDQCTNYSDNQPTEGRHAE